MSYKTILTCLTTAVNAPSILKVACDLARRHGAHLIGLHTLQSPQVYPGVVAELPRPAVDQFYKEQMMQAEEIQAIFEQHTKGEDFVSEWRVVKAASTQASDRMVEHAYCVDLVVMGQADPEHDRLDQDDAQRALIKHSGRPVLVVPHSGKFETVGTHALMGWSATREAGRAIHDAIPLLADGGKATVLWVSKSADDAPYLESTAHEMAVCLDRHGIEATVAHWQNSSIAIGDALLNESFERGADLIVTGAFGHSRFYDFVIGATTTHLLQHMTVPVLFSR